jgi:hypothetical protein
MKLRSLFLAVAGALILTSFLATRANATLIVYFNFENGTLGNSGFDGVADVTPTGGPPPGDNPGGGIQNSMLTWSGTDDSTVDALQIAGTNRTTADNDTTANLALGVNHAKDNNGAFLQFNVNTLLLSNLSLSFAVDNNGNGFHSAQLSYSTTGLPGTFTDVGSAITITTGPNQLLSTGTFNVTPSFGGVFRLTFSGATSNGNDRQTVIDNIQLNATVAPEPATVAGGLFGVIGLCWFQRRRIRLILPRCGFRGLRRA